MESNLRNITPKKLIGKTIVDIDNKHLKCISHDDNRKYEVIVEYKSSVYYYPLAGIKAILN